MKLKDKIQEISDESLNSIFFNIEFLIFTKKWIDKNSTKNKDIEKEIKKVFENINDTTPYFNKTSYKENLNSLIFISNYSIFEDRLSKIFYESYSEKKIDFPGDCNIDLKTIKNEPDIDKRRKEKIEQYILSKSYERKKKRLKDLKLFRKIPNKSTNVNEEIINEISLCRNCLIHNRRKVNKVYLNEVHKKYLRRTNLNEEITITDKILYEATNNLCKYIIDTTKFFLSIKK